MCKYQHQNKHFISRAAKKAHHTNAFSCRYNMYHVQDRTSVLDDEAQTGD